MNKNISKTGYVVGWAVFLWSAPIIFLGTLIRSSKSKRIGAAFKTLVKAFVEK